MDFSIEVNVHIQCSILSFEYVCFIYLAMGKGGCGVNVPSEWNECVKSCTVTDMRSYGEEGHC